MGAYPTNEGFLWTDRLEIGAVGLEGAPKLSCMVECPQRSPRGSLPTRGTLPITNASRGAHDLDRGLRVRASRGRTPASEDAEMYRWRPRACQLGNKRFPDALIYW
jgi:hypothetical protein